MNLVFLLWVTLVLKSVVSISHNNNSSDLTTAIWELSNIAVQGRQSSPYYQNVNQNYQNYPSYYQNYQPNTQQYGYPQNYPPNYQANELYTPSYHYQPTSYPYYPSPSYDPYPSNVRPPFFQKTRESIMDALFSIAQNDDLQCVAKLLCDVTSGGLVGRQGGLNLPLNLNLQSLAGFLSGLNSANMSPVLHFGKAAVLGFASKGNSRSCQYSYPECPSDPDRLVQYLNNHNGGFFRFFQGINPSGQNNLQNYAPQYPNVYRPGYLGKAFAEKRIQNQPAAYVNSNYDRYAYYKGGGGVDFPKVYYTTPISYATAGPKRIIFPINPEQSTEPFFKHYAKTLKFPLEYDNNNDVPFRRGKGLFFEPNFSQTNDNFLDIQRPLPNHVPTKTIFPDRTGTGELKLDFDDVEQNYQQSVSSDLERYNQLLYDSFPNDRRPSRLSFPNK